MSGLFSRFFPTPNFLTLKSVGLSISDNHVRFVEFDAVENRKNIAQKGQVAIPKGVVDRGFISDPKKLSEILEQVRKSVNSPFVAVSVPDEKAYVYQTKIPISDNETTLKSSVEATIEENAPLSLDKVTFSFRIVEKHKDHFDVTVSVAPTKVIESYIDVLQSAGFRPTSFELESYAVAKAVIKKEDKSSVIIVNMHNVKTAFYVIENSTVHFSSSVEHATEDPHTQMPIIESELKKVHNYWRTRGEEGKVKTNDTMRIIVCGEPSADDAVMKEIEKIASVQAERANVWTNAFSFEEYIPDIPLRDSLGFAVAVGLALSASEKNNF